MENAMVIRNPLRARVLSALPLHERRLKLNGITTAVLEGGDGPPLVLLHGAGGYAAHWMRVAPELVRSHRVVAPDLPGHGDSAIWPEAPDAGRVVAWLDDLIDCSCKAPPVLVGETLGGAIAARYASERSERLAALVLVDALGLADFEPAPEFGAALHAYLSAPTAASYGSLMHVCLFDLPRVAAELGDAWSDVDAYNVDRALAPDRIAALGALMQQLGIPAIEPAALEGISAPTTLIWGRQDRATPIAVAQRASERYGWPLHVVEGSGDVPSLEQPAAFLEALRAALAAESAAA
jgi:pimeloyl-ACP methyl ester carboxylesterase